MLRISKTLYSPESNMYKIEITPPKTNAAIRNFDLDDVIIKMLKAYKADQEERQKRYKQVNDDFYDEKYMFSRPNGRPLNQKFLLNRMDRLLKRTTITKHATPYIFRHTHISMLAEAKVDLAVIMQRVGHDDSKTTLKIYTHVTAVITSDASNKVKIHFDNIINPKKSPEM
ncbi:site-specific integrase [Paenibacillus sp. P32E]|nr:site-specific integrase [Paenibacillus sp. P32E]